MRTPRLLALAVAALCAATLAGCATLGDSFDDKIRVTADFANIAGVYEGNDVSLLGLRIGQVDKIEPHGTYVTVWMTISAENPVPAEAIAATLSPSLVTNRHIELAPAYSGSGPKLADGAHIPCGSPCGQPGPGRTRTPVDLDRVLTTVDSIATSLKGKGGAEGPLSGAALEQALRGNGDRIRETIGALSRSVELGVDNGDAISRIIIRLNEITQIIAANDQAVREFGGQTTQLSQLLAEQAPGLQAVFAQLNDFLANTSTVLGQRGGQLGEALTGLTATTDQLRANARNLIEVVDVMPLLFRNIDNSTLRDAGQIRLHFLVDKSLLDGELLSAFRCDPTVAAPGRSKTSEPTSVSRPCCSDWLVPNDVRTSTRRTAGHRSGRTDRRMRGHRRESAAAPTGHRLGRLHRSRGFRQCAEPARFRACEGRRRGCR
ncbi:MCE family protein [Nocardia sp. NBC_00511]|uniref:MCE family protein n=1 Tax=Nocardia sp. NBC_00511 TaxID=2903591 RepID=UPI0030E4FCEB